MEEAVTGFWSLIPCLYEFIFLVIVVKESFGGDNPDGMFCVLNDMCDVSE